MQRSIAVISILFIVLMITEFILIVCGVIRYDYNSNSNAIEVFAALITIFILYLIVLLILSRFCSCHTITKIVLSVIISISILSVSYITPLGTNSSLMLAPDFRVSHVLMLPGYVLSDQTGLIANNLRPINLVNMQKLVCEQSLDEILKNNQIRVTPLDMGIQSTNHIIIYAGFKLEGHDDSKIKYKILRFTSAGELDKDFGLARQCIEPYTKSILITPDDSIYLAIGHFGDSYISKRINGKEHWIAYNEQGNLMDDFIPNISLKKKYEELKFGQDSNLYAHDNNKLFHIDYQKTKQAHVIVDQKTLKDTPLVGHAFFIDFFHVDSLGNIFLILKANSKQYFTHIDSHGVVQKFQQNLCNDRILHRDKQGRLYAFDVLWHAHITSLVLRLFNDEECSLNESYNNKSWEVLSDRKLYGHPKIVWDHNERLILISQQCQLESKVRFPFHVFLPDGREDPSFQIHW
jgi:hypothetical protein